MKDEVTNNKGESRCGCRERERERESNSLKNEVKIEAQLSCAYLGYKDGLLFFVVCLFCVNLVPDTG